MSGGGWVTSVGVGLQCPAGGREGLVLRRSPLSIYWVTPQTSILRQPQGLRFNCWRGRLGREFHAIRRNRMIVPLRPSGTEWGQT